MEKLKVRFKLNALEFELEGSEDTVKNELAEFKNFVVNSLLNKVNLTEPTQIQTSREPELLEIPQTHSVPQLKEIVMKDLLKTEAEWILIYCYYASDYGSEPFKEIDIKKQYELSKRKNESRMKNFSSNFNKVLKNGFIRVLNTDEYVIVPKGIDQALGLLNNPDVGGDYHEEKSNKKIIQKRSKSKTRSGNSKNTSFSLISSLDLNPQGQQSLKSFYVGFMTKSYFERNVLFIYYMERILGVSEIGINHVYTCYKNVGEKVPGNLYQSLVDTKNIKAWIESKDINNLKITISGENYVEHDIQKHNVN